MRVTLLFVFSCHPSQLEFCAQASCVAVVTSRPQLSCNSIKPSITHLLLFCRHDDDAGDEEPGCDGFGWRGWRHDSWDWRRRWRKNQLWRCDVIMSGHHALARLSHMSSYYVSEFVKMMMTSQRWGNCELRCDARCYSSRNRVANVTSLRQCGNYQNICVCFVYYHKLARANPFFLTSNLKVWPHVIQKQPP